MLAAAEANLIAGVATERLGNKVEACTICRQDLEIPFVKKLFPIGKVLALSAKLGLGVKDPTAQLEQLKAGVEMYTASKTPYLKSGPKGDCPAKK